jgi:hypothetical protein
MVTAWGPDLGIGAVAIEARCLFVKKGLEFPTAPHGFVFGLRSRLRISGVPLNASDVLQ